MQVYNSIVFTNGSTLWITQDEANTVADFLQANSAGFVALPRLAKTFNISQIANVGPNQVFLDPKVADCEFSFAFNGLYAKTKTNTEYRFNQGWEVARGQFANGMPFDDLIKLMTVA